MTAQISDQFIYNNQFYSLTGFTEEICFHPGDYEIFTKSASTACWRGFYRTFSIENNELVAKNLNVNDSNINENPLGPIINGVKPKRNKGRFNKTYENINLKIDFTGSILIGKDFIRDLYVHMGFHPAWKYETVFEFTFENGNLKKQENLSDKMSEIRQEWSKLKNKKGEETISFDLDEWIKKTFDQKYNKK
ncbi:hypothetical protein [Aureivirga marina]|uniref:hypothetical protein n=1 Tax=Aureivirga marina TaxID=1182451 RepID=UPI0018CB7F85|nr:hypothetical protein [Aureivirga marina]